MLMSTRPHIILPIIQTILQAIHHRRIRLRAALLRVTLRQEEHRRAAPRQAAVPQAERHQEAAPLAVHLHQVRPLAVRLRAAPHQEEIQAPLLSAATQAQQEAG